MTVVVAGIQINVNGKEDVYCAKSTNDYRFQLGPRQVPNRLTARVSDSLE